MGEAFFEPVDEHTVEATVHTTGPWDPGAQHAGPPAALLGGTMQAAVPDLPFTRIGFEILRPVPVARLSLSVEVVRPGRKVTMVSGTLSDPDGPCLLGRAWGMRRAQLDLEVAPPGSPLPPPPDRDAQTPFFEVASPVGWHTAMDLRFPPGDGGFGTHGPAILWGRPAVALVVGRDWTPLERALVLADAGNGASASADVATWMFINTELTVHLTRHPEGDWVALDAYSIYDPGGVGAAFSVLHDERGPVGRAAQSLFVAPR